MIDESMETESEMGVIYEAGGLKVLVSQNEKKCIFKIWGNQDSAVGNSKSDQGCDVTEKI